MGIIEIIFLFMPTFLGVLAAFGLERLWGSYRDGENRKKLKESLKNELESCVEQLTGEGSLLPTKMWNSSVISGDVRLFRFNERTQLAAIYFEIENHNFDARRVKENEIVARTGPRDLILNGMKASYAIWTRMKEHLLKNEETLKERISEVLKEPW